MAETKRIEALHYIRALYNSGDIASMGSSGAVLCCCVATTMDLVGWTKVNYWNEQLMRVCGFTTYKQLKAARESACKYEWLKYDRSSTRSPGWYECIMPRKIMSHIDHNDGVIRGAMGSQSGSNRGPNRGNLHTYPILSSPTLADTLASKGWKFYGDQSARAVAAAEQIHGTHKILEHEKAWRKGGNGAGDVSALLDYVESKENPQEPESMYTTII